MRISYRPDYVVELPEGHPFPMRKFSELHRILLDETLVRPADVVVPEPVALDDLRLVHTEEYVRKFVTRTLSRAEERRLGLPMSESLVMRSRVAVTGTINAARMAMIDGIAGNIGGGTHHACPDHGEGFCVLNDVAVATRVLQRDGDLGRALIIDLDVHHGNGNAIIFGPDGDDDPDVFTFSMHGEKNFPIRKPRSDLDIGLPDYCSDEVYLSMLARHLPEVIDAANPDLVFYLAGVDVVAGDRYGRLSLSREGLRARDRVVLRALYERELPVAVLLSGGYAKTPSMTADLHAEVHRAAHEIYGRIPMTPIEAFT
jgi:acetoin utilization deacetylase AcuC-like enzyme